MDQNFLIQKILEELESGIPAKTSLLRHLGEIAPSGVLSEMYLELGYDARIHSFKSSPTKSAVQVFLQKSGAFPMIWDVFSPCSSPHQSTNESIQDEDTPKLRGLKYLTGLVRHLVYKNQPTSFKEVAMKLINQLISTEGADRTREEKNVRRRVYDAINVLIAAGILSKEGRNVSWNSSYKSVDNNELRNRRRALKEKRKAFQDSLHKLLAVKQLIRRNSTQSPNSERIRLPFIVMSTLDSSSNHVSLHYNAHMNALQVKCTEKFSVFGDMDVLLALDMHSVSKHKMHEFLKNKKLITFVKSMGRSVIS